MLSVWHIARNTVDESDIKLTVFAKIRVRNSDLPSRAFAFLQNATIESVCMCVCAR